MKNSFLLPVLFFLSLTLHACGGEETPACVASHCSVGQTACLGAAFASCTSAGVWDVNPCGSAQLCDPATKACKAKACHKPGVGVCVAVDKVNVCSADGSYTDEQTCASGSTCTGGACLVDQCTPGAKACAFGKDGAIVMICSGGWAVDAECGAAQYCDASGDAICRDLACTPGALSCDGDTAVGCDGTGQQETRTACASTETCKGGACVAAICGAVDASDAGPTGDTLVDADTGPEEEDVVIPPTETIAQVEFDVGNIHHSFDLNAQALYVTGESLLMVLGGSGLRQLEIRFSPIDPDDLGNFTDTDDSEVGVLFCYNDGIGDDAGFGGCQVGFTHASIEYDVTIDANNGKGSWVSGTFSTTLINSINEQIRLSNGKFNVLFK